MGALPVVEVRGLVKTFGQVRACDGIDLAVTKGELLGLVGRSGSGKSTLLRHLNALERPDSGDVTVFGVDATTARGKPLRALRRRVGVVFQQFNLIGRLTVLENVLAGALGRVRGPRYGILTWSREDRGEAREALDRVGLADRAYERAGNLSGGQQQRVGIARMLMQRPELVLGLHSIGMLGRLFTEAVERCDDGVHDAYASTGATRLQHLAGGVLPQVVPAWLAAVLFRLDINVRHSELLGAVGAGGIGLDLKTAFGLTNYREAVGIALVTVVLVLVLEAVAVGLRGLLIGSTGSWRRSRTVAHITGWLGAALVVFSAWQVGAGPVQLVQFVTGSYAALGQFWPPDFAPVAAILPAGLAETFAIALAATALGVLTGIPLGLLAARGVVSSRRGVHLVARAVLVGLRSIPDLLLILVFVAMFGLLEGAVAATCALAVFTAAMVGKLVADDAEELPAGTRQAIVSTGAGRTQELVTWLFGHLTPTWTSTTLYALDVNLRAFVVLGVVGAGELGYALSLHIRALNYDAVTAIVLPVFVVILLVEAISAALKGALR